jgi:hypothetical protein
VGFVSLTVSGIDCEVCMTIQKVAYQFEVYIWRKGDSGWVRVGKSHNTRDAALDDLAIFKDLLPDVRVGKIVKIKVEVTETVIDSQEVVYEN